MRVLRGDLAITLLLGGVVALALPQPAHSQTSTARAPTVPGVTRAVEHPDPSVDQTQPDSHQPETASDAPASGPETARDDHVGQPETATDAPKPTPQQKAEDEAKRGVHSNSPPATKPHD